MPEKEKETEVKKEKKRFEVVEVATQTGLTIKDNDSGETVSELQILEQILNKLDRIEKSVA